MTIKLKEYVVSKDLLEQIVNILDAQQAEYDDAGEPFDNSTTAVEAEAVSKELRASLIKQDEICNHNNEFQL